MVDWQNLLKDIMGKWRSQPLKGNSCLSFHYSLLDHWLRQFTSSFRKAHEDYSITNMQFFSLHLDMIPKILL